MLSTSQLHELFLQRPLTIHLLKSDRRIGMSGDLNGRMVPVFKLSRGVAGVVWGVRKDVPEKIAFELDRLVSEEWPIRDFEEPPLHTDRYRSLVNGRIVSGPSFSFPDKIPIPTGGVAIIDRLEMLERHFRGWTAEEIPSCSPIVAVTDCGFPVSVCFCASGDSAPAVQAGVETAGAFRRSGFAARVTAAWALAIRAAGRIPVYSTDWDNLGSRGVARKLGLIQYASDWSIVAER
jgi:hypothetical protein